MDIWMIFAVLFFGLLLLLFFSDLFPKCLLCGKVKPRFSFRIHQRTGILPGYRFGRAICHKCCTKYDIRSLKKYEQVKRARNKAEMDL